ncbi:hypothetical protein K466DRAFT_664517 [Polyporus arcularius HHB13444]|uniref:BTB domain-containing protein n=1 Tax=Polyporus arcularius HHB13444 TaxID=1314778 RepID=A0A5C3P7D0_9APHY|nr:hypothetical protein K466DRAFT_664517 [Polyporus arcularius HHB13444]
MSPQHPDEGMAGAARSARLRARGVPYMGDTQGHEDKDDSDDIDSVDGYSPPTSMRTKLLDSSRKLDAQLLTLRQERSAKRPAEEAGARESSSAPKRPKLIDRITSVPQPKPESSQSAHARPAAIEAEAVKETPVTITPSQQARTGSATVPPAPIDSREIKTESVQGPLDHRAPVQQRPSAECAPAPAVAEPIFPPLNARSTEFWYRDGNIIVNAEGTYFQLLLSRLERHCGYFERVSIDRAWTVVNGQKVVEVRDLKLQDFETFLKYLEIPMGHSVKDASKETAMSLLRASRVLACKVIGDLAEARVLGPWSSATVPTPGDGLAGRPYRETLEMFGVAQALNAPLVRKHTLYALLADDHFWSDVASHRAQVDISDADLLMLYRIRATMQEKWRVHVLAPPKPCQNSACLPDEETRSALWSGQMAKYATTEVRDPLRNVEGVKTAVRKLTNWCRVCVDERVRALENAGDLWWKELDQLLKIVVPGAQA